MKLRVVVLGAGFGGLELSSILSEQLGDDVDVTLIDRNETFFLGFSKLDVMFGRKTPDEVLLKYGDIVKPGVQFRRETITAIDPTAKHVTTDAGSYDADVLVLALGADYDIDATPGLAEGGNEFYTFGGAEELGDVLPTFANGHAVIGVCGDPFKCPPAPSEAALLLHDFLVERGVRGTCDIKVVIPKPAPVPPSPDTSKALLAAFGERGIEFIPGRFVRALEPAKGVAVLDDGSELPYDLFLGIPKHKVPDVVAGSGMTENGWVPVDPQTLATRFPGVYAIGDVTSVGTPKAGVFAEGAAQTVAAHIIAQVRGDEAPAPYRAVGECYIEFGTAGVGRVNVEFLDGPPRGTFDEPSAALAEEKKQFGAARRARWFGGGR